MTPSNGFTKRKKQLLKKILRIIASRHGTGLRPIAQRAAISHEEVRLLLDQAFDAQLLIVNGVKIDAQHLRQHGSTYEAVRFVIRGSDPYFTSRQHEIMRACAQSGDGRRLASRLGISTSSVQTTVYEVAHRLGLPTPHPHSPAIKNGGRFYLACCALVTQGVTKIHTDAYPSVWGLVPHTTLPLLRALAQNPKVQQQTVAQTLLGRPSHNLDAIKTALQRATRSLCEELGIFSQPGMVRFSHGGRWTALQGFVGTHKTADQTPNAFAKMVFSHAASRRLIAALKPQLEVVARAHTDPAAAQERLQRLLQNPFEGAAIAGTLGPTKTETVLIAG